MPDPSKHASTAAPPKRARREYGFHVEGMPPVPDFGGESPPKRHKASAKEASPRLTQEMPRRPSSDEERNTPTASGQVAEPMPDHDAAAPDHENLEDAAASASAVLGEEPFVPDWGDSNVQTECAAASNDLESGDQTANQDGLGPNDEDAAAEPPKPFPGFPRSVVYNIGSCLGTQLTGHRLRVTEGATVAYCLMRLVDVRAEPKPKPFPGFPRSVVYNIARFLGTELIRTNPGIAYYLAHLLDVRAEDQQGPGPGASATASGQASRSETRGLVPFPPFTPNDPRLLLCEEPTKLENLANHNVQGVLWPPFLKDRFQPRTHGRDEKRKEYRVRGRGITPVFTASGQDGHGTLWVGDMTTARHAPTIADNRIRVRINCSGEGWRREDFGGDSRTPDVLDLLPDLHVEGFLRGEGHPGDLWETLREVDARLESGKSVLLYCQHGEYHSAFVAMCYLKSKCRISGVPFRNCTVFGFLQLLRSVIVENVYHLLEKACPRLEHFDLENPFEKTSPLPLIVTDGTFQQCCCERTYSCFRITQITLGEKSKHQLDSIRFGTASGQERQGNEAKDTQEGNTPTASGQGAAPVPVEGTASVKGAGTGTASGQDAAAHAASNQGKVEKGSNVDEGVGSKQEPRPEWQEHDGIEKTHEDIQREKLLQENATLKKRVFLLEQEMQLIRAMNDQKWQLVIQLINDGANVNVKERPGMMTPLHLAARETELDVVELLLKKRADANALTSTARMPGGYCPLAYLEDSAPNGQRWYKTSRIAKLLFDQMDKKTFADHTTPTGKTVWHLFASQGKIQLLGLLLHWFKDKFGSRDLKEQLDTLTINNETTGKTVLDEAMFHPPCHDLVKRMGGVHRNPKARE